LGSLLRRACIDGKDLTSSLNTAQSLGTNTSKKEFLVLKNSETFLPSKGLFLAEQLSLGTMTKPSVGADCLVDRAGEQGWQAQLNPSQRLRMVCSSVTLRMAL